MNISWSPKAWELFEELKWNIANRSSSKSAEKYAMELLLKINELSSYPERYPPCRNLKFKALEFRCFTHKKSYTVVYRVTDCIRIIGFIHSKRHPNNQFKDIFE